MRGFFYKLGYPFLQIYWFVFRPKTAGAKCIVQCGHEVLLIKNTYGKGWWNLPGGGIESGETPEDAVRREVREEVGITDMSDLALFKEIVSTREGKRDRVYCFAGQVKNMEYQKDPVEIGAAGWFPLRALPINLSPVAKEALTEYRNSSPPERGS